MFGPTSIVDIRAFARGFKFVGFVESVRIYVFAASRLNRDSPAFFWALDFSEPIAVLLPQIPSGPRE